MKITVAIPTIAGREKYLASSLRTCIMQSFDDFEILVSDNSIEHNANALVTEFGDKRIKYVYPPEYMPMSRHWDFVLSQVTGDMLCIIGDDDGLMPGCIQRVSELIKEYPARIIHHSLCNYFWPDYMLPAKRNLIRFFHQIGDAVSVISAKDVLRGMCNGRLGYLDGPMVYHNFVPTSLLRQLAREGTFFRRSSPDVYSSVALAANVDYFVSTQECLTFSGQGARANGTSVIQGGKDGNKFIMELELFYKPRFKSRTVNFALLDCILEVAEEFDNPHIVKDILYEKFLTGSLFEIGNIPDWKLKFNETVEVIKVSICKGVLTQVLADVGKMVYQWVKKKPAPLAIDSNLSKGSELKLPQSVTNIYEASLALQDIINDNKRKVHEAKLLSDPL